jgi:hypothetical protein
VAGWSGLGLAEGGCAINLESAADAGACAAGVDQLGAADAAREISVLRKWRTHEKSATNEVKSTGATEITHCGTCTIISEAVLSHDIS